jgi:hypothetical protein
MAGGITSWSWTFKRRGRKYATWSGASAANLFFGSCEPLIVNSSTTDSLQDIAKSVAFTLSHEDIAYTLGFTLPHKSYWTLCIDTLRLCEAIIENGPLYHHLADQVIYSLWWGWRKLPIKFVTQLQVPISFATISLNICQKFTVLCWESSMICGFLVDY